ncbi:hydroxymethylbilane synthase [Tessaracoccus sp. ZS01]|uniref:hydroxymethylbilane synthase n=1 Tax=Tessaracoccus sp. ZS01 TaxID=1906324 RepID=UPI00096DDFAC|nr:hydroxymethylbilane synthase [Tessaracoccus sp. ZS01]MCG6566659.1 hydroxymethylbilane synthase [Tessaracoccus sp. ZS01]OMG59079.1 hydroxymethylbilane synthase [Tessaracoccus sp. ZS01]
MKLRLGTRGSALALARSEMVAELLRAQGHEVDIVRVATEHVDTIHMADGYSLGVFAQELRTSLRSGAVDVVVHSVKDVPLSDRPEDLTFAAVLKRGDHRDALCSLRGMPLAALPRRSRIGITSLRRLAQLRALRPDLTFVDVGGTLQDRLRRLEPGDLDAVVVSAAGVHALKVEDRVAEYLPILTAPGQGALALECRRSDEETLEAVRELDDVETRICIEAERAVLTGLNTTYLAPVGALATRRGILGLKAGIFSIDGTKRTVLEIGLPTSEYHAQRTGHNVAEALKARRADRFITAEALETVKMTADHADDSTFIESSEDDDRVRVLLPRQEGRISQAMRENELRVDCVQLQEARLLSADNIIGDADWVVIPSGQTVWALRERGWDIPAHTKVATMGSTTQRTVEDSGRQVDLSPEGTASSQKLVELFPPADGEQRVVILCADQLSTKLETGLRAKGYTVDRSEIYTMADVAEIDPALRTRWDDGAWDAVFLSQPSLAHVYAKTLGHRDDVRVLAWDEATAAAVREEGVDVFAVAKSKDTFGIADLARQLHKARH